MGRRHSIRERIAELESQGFDQTYASGRYLRPKCSQCDALVIQGVACHETGCRNQVYECNGCSAVVERRGAYCHDCLAQMSPSSSHDNRICGSVGTETDPIRQKRGTSRTT